ncbi:alpha/beta fold hydrolase [Sphingosinithalassobacter portus]|uniref:alpha/beta fold hydrolase n=1 Tax=Stakelama portus TaxID=2676234 RepID=UPI000D6EA489|nr:alpha/beta fold hydrolase [Sphingosinithalassobacter portus]
MRKLGRAAAILAGALTCHALPASAQMEIVRADQVTNRAGVTLFVTRGTIMVPAVRGDERPGDAPVKVAFVRISRAVQPSETATFVLAGGPGGSGIGIAESIVRNGDDALFDMFGGDVIGMDQRGTGASTPAPYFPAPYDLPLDVPGSPAAWLPIIAPQIRAAAAEMRAQGIRPEMFATREAADDIDMIRSGLGYARMNLFGSSYGSHLALSVLRHHGDRVNRVVLIGPEGPDDSWKLPDHVDAAIARIGAAIGDPDLPDRMRRVIGRLREAPVTVPVMLASGVEQDVTLGAFDLQYLSYSQPSGREGLITLARQYRAMEAGDFSQMAWSAMRVRQNMSTWYAMSQITDIAAGASAERAAAIDAQAPDSILGNAINFPDRALADAWGVTPEPAAERAPIHSDVPVLILVGDLDMRTPIENGEALIETLPNGHLVVVENAAHQFDIFGSPEIRGVIAPFIAGEPVTVERITLPVGQ